MSLADVKACMVCTKSLCGRFSFPVVSLCSTPGNGQCHLSELSGRLRVSLMHDRIARLVRMYSG